MVVACTTPPYCHDAEPTFLSILAHFSFLTDFKRKLTRDNILSVKKEAGTNRQGDTSPGLEWC